MPGPVTWNLLHNRHSGIELWGRREEERWVQQADNNRTEHQQQPTWLNCPMQLAAIEQSAAAPESAPQNNYQHCPNNTPCACACDWLMPPRLWDCAWACAWEPEKLPHCFRDLAWAAEAEDSTSATTSTAGGCETAGRGRVRHSVRLSTMFRCVC